VHLSITLANDQLDAQIFNTFIIFIVCKRKVFTFINNAADYIIVILDNSLLFRVTIPDAILTFKNRASYIYRTGVPLPSRCRIIYIFFQQI